MSAFSSVGSLEEHCNDFGDAHRLVAAPPLDGDAEDGLGSLRSAPQFRQLHHAPHLGVHGCEGRATDLVAAVVDGGGQPLGPRGFRQEHGDEGRDQIAVGDRRSVRALRGLVRVEVDPLVIAGDIGETVDVILGRALRRHSPPPLFRCRTRSPEHSNVTLLASSRTWSTTLGACCTARWTSPGSLGGLALPPLQC